MIKKLLLLNAFLCCLTLFSCGQDHLESQNWLTKFKSAAESTVVLNNSEKEIPLLNLENRNIALADLGFKHTLVFDSLLNKYSKVQFFDAKTASTSVSLNKQH